MSLSICWCCGKATLQADIDRAGDPATSSVDLWELWNRPNYTCRNNPVRHAIALNPNITVEIALALVLHIDYVPDLLANPALDFWVIEGFPGWERFDLERLLAVARRRDDLHAPAIQMWFDAAYERWWRDLL